MTDFDPLQPEQCRLMSSFPELIRRHNDLAGMLARVRDHLPMVWEDAIVVRELLPLYGKTRQIVSRSHYRVGFIGGSQAGKSSTFNSVLGFQLADQQGPATGGAGKATTSTTTRLRRKEPADNALPHCVSRYMTRTQVDKRLRSLVKEFNLPELEAWNGDARQLLEAAQTALATLQQQAAAPQRILQEGDVSLVETKATAEDLLHLVRFLKALLATDAQGVPAIDRLIRDPAIEQPFPYEQREQFINHQRDGNNDDKLLQREVEVHFPTDCISDRLEMIDLPGLNAMLIADTVLTTEFITEELDASVVFLRSDEVAPGPFFKMMNLFKRHFQNEIDDRVWLVVTKVDGLTQNQLPLDEDRESVIDNLAQSLDKTEIPYEHAYFTSSIFYTSYAKSEERGTPNPNQLAHQWGIDRGVTFDADKPKLPPSWAKGNEVLNEAIKKVFRAGGIGEVRELLQKTIAEKVERRIRARCHSDLREIARRFAGIIEATKSLMSQDPRNLVHAAEWAAKVQEARNILLGDFQRFSPPAQAFRDEMLSQFQRICGPNQRIRPEGLPRKHQGDARSLLLSAEMSLRREMLPRLIEMTGELLTNGPPDVALWGHRNPYEAWQKRRPQSEEDWRKLAAESYQPVVASLMSDELFPSTHLENFMNVQQYRVLMQEKIRVVSHQVMHSVLLYLDRQLAEMEEQLLLIQHGSGKVSAFDGGPPPEVFDELSQGLRDIARDPSDDGATKSATSASVSTRVDGAAPEKPASAEPRPVAPREAGTSSAGDGGVAVSPPVSEPTVENGPTLREDAAEKVDDGATEDADDDELF